MNEAASSEPTAQDASERRASYLELFFDLVFVYAVTQIANLIIGDTSPGGFARAALMLGLVWWAWSAFAWMTNAIDLSTVVGRVTLLLASASSFFVALAVPEAFSGAGEWFAIPYLTVRVLHIVVYLYGLRNDPVYQRAVLRSTPFWLVSPVLIVIGGSSTTRRARGSGCSRWPSTSPARSSPAARSTTCRRRTSRSATSSS